MESTNCVPGVPDGEGFSHSWTWEPLEGQEWPAAGRYRLTCDDCGWTVEETLDGTEVWMA